MRVGLFVTCLIDLMRPEIGFSVIKLIEGAGFEVVVPPAQTCCGQPAYNSGERRIARDLAEKTLREFEQFDYVVVPSGVMRRHDPRALWRPVRRRSRTDEPLRAFARQGVRADRFPRQCGQGAVAAG